ncbi:MAG TPA: hypothetical protein VKM36_05755 [Balneolaceae bacterium]|nr:hypothetical protein [Balneolaceae bacterium]
MDLFSRHKKILAGILLINILLVATHEGEFWPFSIFPMFSQAGNPWSRALVIEVDNPSDEQLWGSVSLEEVNGRFISLYGHGVDAIDYANFISKTKEWNDRRVKALRDLLDAESLGDKKWLIARVDGHLTETDSVVVSTVPLFLLTADSTHKNPKLF